MPDLSSAIRGASERLESAGSPAPRIEAERLAARAIDAAWGDLWTRLHEQMDVRASELLETFVDRRARGEPLAFIEGSTGFFGLDIACGPGALVPRPETETLVEVALGLIGDVQSPVVVDIGTGTGAIAVAIFAHRPDAQVWATDIDEDALVWARRNAPPKIRLRRGDLFEALPLELAGRVDLVVSNPPYIASGAELPADVSAEPATALFAGPRGDEILLRLAREALPWIGPHGSLAFEVGTRDQADTVVGELAGLRVTGVGDDLSGRPRVVWATR